MCGLDAKYFVSKNSEIINNIFIKNNISNTCVNCKFGIPYISNNPFDERDPIDYNFRCQKFNITNIIDNEIENQLARICRYNEKMCGINGKYFTKNI